MYRLHLQGIFRVCFPHGDRPPAGDDDLRLHLSWWEDWCSNVDYRVGLLDFRSLVPERLTHYGEMWHHLARASVAAFVLYFMLVGVGCVTGLTVNVFYVPYLLEAIIMSL